MNVGALKLLDCVVFLCLIPWLKLHILIIMLRYAYQIPGVLRVAYHSYA